MLKYIANLLRTAKIEKFLKLHHRVVSQFEFSRLFLRSLRTRTWSVSLLRQSIRQCFLLSPYLIASRRRLLHSDWCFIYFIICRRSLSWKSMRSECEPVSRISIFGLKWEWAAHFVFNLNVSTFRKMSNLSGHFEVPGQKLRKRTL